MHIFVTFLGIQNAPAGAFPLLVSKAVPGATPPWPMVPLDGDPHLLEELVAPLPQVGVLHHLQTL